MKCPKCENPMSDFYTGVPGVLCQMGHGRIAGRIQCCPDCNRFRDRAVAALKLIQHVAKTTTWIEPRELAELHGDLNRRGRAIWPDGKIYDILAGIALPNRTIPAKGLYKRKQVYGHVTVNKQQQWVFQPDPQYHHLFAKEKKG